jgi:hypothetical protein
MEQLGKQLCSRLVVTCQSVSDGSHKYWGQPGHVTESLCLSLQNTQDKDRHRQTQSSAGNGHHAWKRKSGRMQECAPDTAWLPGQVLQGQQCGARKQPGSGSQTLHCLQNLQARELCHVTVELGVQSTHKGLGVAFTSFSRAQELDCISSFVPVCSTDGQTAAAMCVLACILCPCVPATNWHSE